MGPASTGMEGARAVGGAVQLFLDEETIEEMCQGDKKCEDKLSFRGRGLNELCWDLPPQIREAPPYSQSSAPRRQAAAVHRYRLRVCEQTRLCVYASRSGRNAGLRKKDGFLKH